MNVSELNELKKCFYKCIFHKRRAKRNLHPLLDVPGNMITEDKEKAEVLNAFITSVFNSWTSYPRGTLPPDLEIWDEEQNKSPTIQLETVRDLLLHLDCHEPVGPDGMHPRVLKEMVGVIAKLLSTISSLGQPGEVPEFGEL